MDNCLLSLLIPTYNRSQNLDKQLSILTEICKGSDFKIIICNNFSSDETDVVVKKWQQTNENIVYFIQKENVGYDRNLSKCISLVQSDYFWILGDSAILDEKYFKEIVSLLKKERPNAIVLNSFDKIKNLESQYFNSSDEILKSIGWNMTHLNSMIISSEASNTTISKRYYGTNFVHLGIFFEYIVSLDSFKVFYFSHNPYIHINQFITSGKGTYWAQRKYEVFCEDWFFAIMSLPNQISKEAKLKCIKDHAMFNNLFSYKRVLRDRAKNIIDRNRFKYISEIFPFITDTPVWYVKLVNCIPLAVFNIIRKFVKFF